MLYLFNLFLTGRKHCAGAICVSSCNNCSIYCLCFASDFSNPIGGDRLVFSDLANPTGCRRSLSHNIHMLLLLSQPHNRAHSHTRNTASTDAKHIVSDPPVCLYFVCVCV